MRYGLRTLSGNRIVVFAIEGKARNGNLPFAHRYIRPIRQWIDPIAQEADASHVNSFCLSESRRFGLPSSVGLATTEDIDLGVKMVLFWILQNVSVILDLSPRFLNHASSSIEYLTHTPLPYTTHRSISLNPEKNELSRMGSL